MRIKRYIIISAIVGFGTVVPISASVTVPVTVTPAPSAPAMSGSSCASPQTYLL